MATMRWIDHWIGLPSCFCLALCLAAVRKLGLHRSRAISGTRTLAIFKFFGLGSVIETTPLLRAIRARYPNTRLVFVTFEENAPLVRRLNLCTDVCVIRTSSALRFVRDVLAQIIWFWYHRTEAVVDLEFFSKFSTLLSFFSGARVRVGFHLNDFWRYGIVTHPIYFNYYRHITDVYRAAAQRLDVAINDTRLSRIDVGDTARHSAREFLIRHGWSPSMPLVGINVNAGAMSLERRWPLERFALVAKTLLLRQTDLHLVLVGSPTEQPYVSSLLTYLPGGLHDRVIVAAGRLSFEEFIAALSELDLLITNDSGPMHLAAAQGTPLVSLWGPGKPDFYAPRVDNHRAIYRDYPCSPCLYMFTTFEGMWCNHEGWCMLEIQAQAVVDAAEELLTQVGRRPITGPPGSTTTTGTEM